MPDNTFFTPEAERADSAAGKLPRRAVLATPVVGILTFAVMTVAAVAMDLPINDPDGAVLGSPLVLIAVVLVLFVGLDVVPRAARRTGWPPAALRAAIRAVWSERWSTRRLVVVVAALLGWYLTYVGYRNLKSYLPFARDTSHDLGLIELDRVMAFGNDPGVLMQDLLGRGVAAELLSIVYVAFLLFVPISLGVAVVWQRRLHIGLWYVTAMNIAWVLGVLSYYALPALGPAFVTPEHYATLPPTGVSALQEALVEHRATVLANPHGAEGVQSIAAFASLHVAIVLVAALIAQLLGLARGLRIGLWVFLGLTILATVYFGWHYIIDDIAGIFIGVAAVALAAKATGHAFRPAAERAHGVPAVAQATAKVT